MTEMSKWFNAIADEADGQDEMVRRLRWLKQEVERRARRDRLIAWQRDELIARIADALGIDRSQFPDFFENLV